MGELSREDPCTPNWTGMTGRPSSRPARMATGSQRDEASEHVVIGRLIRRLRVSEPPDRFHQLAANVLRSSLGVEAVAWVPRETNEPVIVAGNVDELGPSSYRALSQSENHEGAAMYDEVGAGPSLAQRIAGGRADTPGSPPARPDGSSRSTRRMTGRSRRRRSNACTTWPRSSRPSSPTRGSTPSSRACSSGSSGP